jgi:hypothetical protein
MVDLHGTSMQVYMKQWVNTANLFEPAARQVQAFKCGSVSNDDMHSSGWYCMSVAISEQCMDKDRC